MLSGLGLATVTADTDALTCERKCKKKPKDKRKACTHECNSGSGGAIVDRMGDDFATQAEAQAFFLSDGGPP